MREDSSIYFFSSSQTHDVCGCSGILVHTVLKMGQNIIYFVPTMITCPYVYLQQAT